MGNLMKFVMVIISIAFLAYLNAYLTAQAIASIKRRRAPLPKRKLAA